MKKFFALTVLLLMMSASCFAMSFQQPVEIGTVSTGGDNSITIDGTTNVDATSGGKQNTYIKGVAIFDNSLYLHFDGDLLKQRVHPNISSAEMMKIYNEVSFFGGRDKRNAVPFFVFEGRTKIYRIGNDAGLELYLLALETGGGGSMEVIGKHGDKWVKFFNTNDARKTYDIPRDFYFMEFRTAGDEIIFRYAPISKNTSRELHYKWDPSAQWFGIRVI